jgi:hypothetical protein
VAKPMVALTPSDSPVMFEYIFPIPPLKAGVCGPRNNSGDNSNNSGIITMIIWVYDGYIIWLLYQ